MTAPVNTTFTTGTTITSEWLNGVNDTVNSFYVSELGSVTINVPTDFATIQEALSFLSNKTILSNCIVTIQVADGTYTYPSVVYLNHPQGSQIHIVGNETTPSNCVLQYSTSDGFYLPPGYQLGKLNGFRIVNTTVKNAATPYLGILTDGGAYLQVGPQIEVHNFYYGISARNGGYINAGGTSTNYVKVTDAGDVGIWSFIGSYVNCEYAEVSGTDDSVNGLGGGIVAEFDSSIQANHAYVHNNWLCGMSSLSSSSIRAWNSTSNNNQFGYMTYSNGSIEIYSSTVTNNSIYGYQSLSGGQVLGWETCTESGNNTYNGFSYRASFYQAPDGYSATLNTGQLAIAGDGPQAGSSGDAYLDLRASTNKYAIQRYLINNVEKIRTQFDGLNNIYTLGGNGKIAQMFNPQTGMTKIGVGSPSTSATTGHLQIPHQAGTPTGVVTDSGGGYSSIVYDTTNNKLWIFNGVSGGWRSVTLT